MPINKKNTFEQHDNENGSFYHNSVNFPILSNNTDSNFDVDVCIIGGGLTGISSALNIVRKGYSVILLEARKIGWGASGRNGGQLGIGMRKSQSSLEKKLGINHAKELWKLGLEAVNEAKDHIKKYKIDCALQNGVLTAGSYKKDEKEFLYEIDYIQKNYDFDKYEFFNFKKIKEEINSKKYFSGLLNKGSYHLNPLKFLLGLTNQLINLNVNILENTPVTNIEETSDGIKIITQKNIIKAKYAVVGCNGYLDKLLGKKRNKFMPINNYIIATEPLREEKAKQLIKNNYAVCDTRFIIDYYRFSEDWRMIFGGGETYTASFNHDSENFVKKRMYKVFPELKKYKIEFSWGGTLAITVNRLPDFGTMMNGKLIYAHGYSGHGLALSTLAGKLIAEKISGFSDRFNFFESIKHISIPGGDFFRRPIYSASIAYYKMRDIF